MNVEEFDKKVGRYKFRAWDNVSKSMISNIHRVFSFREYFIDKNYTVEQFVGLKDKNGKEIYEGDILKRKDFLFYDGNFVFLPVEYKYAEWELGIRRLNDIYKSSEIVGNIHENPELLEAAR